MMTMALEDPAGSQQRERSEDARKRDRVASILYGRVSDRSGGWSRAAQWTLNNGLFLGTVIDVDDSILDPADRPGIQTLAALAWPFAVPGHVLVQLPQRSTADHARTLAVIATYLDKYDRRMVFFASRSARPCHVQAKDRQRWVAQAGSQVIAEQFERLEAVAVARVAAMMSPDRFATLMSLGDGPPRDLALARQVAEVRLADGWSQQRVRDYLALYGFTNPSGTVGRWGHDQYTRLMQVAP